MFDKFQVVMFNPTPKWRFEDLHVDKRSGLPYPEIQQQMLKKYFIVYLELYVTEKICTLGVNASRASRKIDEQLHEGCAMLYMREYGQIY